MTTYHTSYEKGDKPVGMRYHLDDIHEEHEKVQRIDYQPINKNFSRRYLRCDGVVIMRLFDMNIDLVTMNDLVNDLWELYRVNPT